MPGSNLHPPGEENQTHEEEKVSEYEKVRLRNIAESRRLLQELGLLHPFQEAKPILKKTGFVKARVSVKRPLKSDKDREITLSPPPKRRSSRRLRGFDANCPVERDEYIEEDASEPSPSRTTKRDNFYGHIEGIDVGHWWQTRLECCRDGIHRPTVAGIHPGPEGAYSIALSGGYEDDIDFGESFTYSGAGGRDLKGTKTNPKNLRTAKQSKNQTLGPMNHALVTSVETGKPVRVIRGYKLRSDFAPEEGYRYDGLYSVKKWWMEPGKSGFLIYKYALERVANQDPPPWERDCLAENSSITTGQNQVEGDSNAAETDHSISENTSAEETSSTLEN